MTNAATMNAREPLPGHVGPAAQFANDAALALIDERYTEAAELFRHAARNAMTEDAAVRYEDAAKKADAAHAARRAMRVSKPVWQSTGKHGGKAHGESDTHESRLTLSFVSFRATLLLHRYFTTPGVWHLSAREFGLERVELRGTTLAEAQLEALAVVRVRVNMMRDALIKVGA